MRVDENHPLLARILTVRRVNASSFKLHGNEWEAYDRAVLDCYHAIEGLLTATPATPQPDVAALVEALNKINDAWVNFKSNGDEYDEGYDNALEFAALKAKAALAAYDEAAK